LTWPWVPHVTLADDAPPERIAAAIEVLNGYAVTVTCDRLVLLEEQHGDDGRRWVAAADAEVGPRVVVGRGGLPVELTTGRLLDPEARALVNSLSGRPPPALLGGVEPVRTTPAAGGSEGPGSAVRGVDGPFPCCVAARREGAVVGVAAAWSDSGRGYLGVAVDPRHRGQGIGTHLRARIESRLAEAGWPGGSLEPWGSDGS
jgi:GNAT superfamily N-acetyltransferase